MTRDELEAEVREAEAQLTEAVAAARAHVATFEGVLNDRRQRLQRHLAALPAPLETPENGHVADAPSVLEESQLQTVDA